MCLTLALAGLLSGTTLMLKPMSRATAQGIEPSWSLTGSLFRARTGHTATLLANGQVLVAGGYNDAGPPLNSEELYDPATGTWKSAGHLNATRFDHTATLLPNGKVLFAGGLNRMSAGSPPGSVLNSAELYDPATGTWSNTGNLNTGRSGHTATLLPNGKVLVSGGGYYTGSAFNALNSAELYDPATGRWGLAGNLQTARRNHTATLLPSGQLLVVGVHCCGIPVSESAELYDPVTGTWSSAGQLNIGNANTATLLPNGKVLVTEGSEDDPATAELYDPATGMWSVTGRLNAYRHYATATLLPNGKVLAAEVLLGDAGVLTSTELYDPATGIWSGAPNPNTGRYGHTATLLPNGKVLMAGGQHYGYLPPFNSAELFDLGLPQAGTVTSVSAASFSLMGLASEAITASFGARLATATQTAPSVLLPTTLAGATVKVKDSAGIERFAPLFFVSPTQVNYQIRPGTAAGPATVTITSGDGTVSTGLALIKAVAPGLFTANGNGQGVAAAVAVRVKADGSQQLEPVAQFDAAQNKFIARPLDLGPETEQVFLILFGTGIRQRSSLSAVIATIGGAYAQVSFAEAQPGLVGVDQVNVLVPRSLAGRGEVDVLLTVEAQMANAVRVNIR
jgi:uncharacterized protein (TIGR03437 family)